MTHRTLVGKHLDLAPTLVRQDTTLATARPYSKAHCHVPALKLRISPSFRQMVGAWAETFDGLDVRSRVFDAPLCCAALASGGGVDGGGGADLEEY